MSACSACVVLDRSAWKRDVTQLPEIKVNMMVSSQNSSPGTKE